MAFFNRKSYTGFTKETPDKIQLDAGAFFKNYDPEIDTYATAKAAGKLLGATQGGGEFVAKPVLRQIPVDGIKGRAKGLTDIDEWEVSLKVTLLETDKDTLALALGASAEIADAGIEGYRCIKGKMGIEDTDYLENVTWLGRVSGQDKPLIIQVFNALNEDGLTYTVADKAEGKIGLTFYGYTDALDIIADEVLPPFAIWEPAGETEGE